MKTKSRIWILILSIMSIFLSRCKTEEIILHGEISGLVTDASTIQPVGAAYVKLSQSNDSTITGSDGTYLLKSLTPGDYEIQASKSSFVTSNNKVTVVPAKTQVNDFSLNPVPKISVSVLDFSLESTSLSFTISYAGKTKLSYLFSTSQDDWITVHPSSGVLLGETDTITVTINRTGLTENIYKETIRMTAVIGQVTIPDIITGVYLNGASDQDGNYYKVVKIGTQIWMAENLNVGISIPDETDPADNGIIEKYCNNCNIYGGLYNWNEMMGYNLPDSGIIGNTQGICPTGWHVPTETEWTILINYLGGLTVAGGKLKEIGINHWLSPNAGATDESGFTGLPAGLRLPLDAIAQGYMNFYKESAIWWSSTWAYTLNNFEYYKNIYVRYDDVAAFITDLSPDYGMSVRCVKDE